MNSEHVEQGPVADRSGGLMSVNGHAVGTLEAMDEARKELGRAESRLSDSKAHVQLQEDRVESALKHLQEAASNYSAACDDRSAAHRKSVALSGQLQSARHDFHVCCREFYSSEARAELMEVNRQFAAAAEETSDEQA